MPSTIPYDPSLVLGNIVHPNVLSNLVKIGTEQAKIDKAEDELNALISLRNSLDMTAMELINMKVDVKDLTTRNTKVGEDITKAAVAYADAKIKGLEAIKAIKGESIVKIEVESPIDYNKSAIKAMPLAADSLKMNVQYFSASSNEQDSTTIATQIGGFVSDSLEFLGDEIQQQASFSASSQANSQHSRHKIAGTLVISIACTHKQAQVLAPFILNVDKAIRSWNQLFPSDKIDIDVPNPAKVIADIAKASDSNNQNAITLLSGATYGSCFVGMVHILNTTDTVATETMVTLAASLQEQFKVGGWFAQASGGFGIDSSFSADAKSLLSTQSISSHCTLTTMGSIPSMKSNEVKMAVQQFAKFDGAESMKQVQTIQNATAGDKDSIDASATAARTGAQMVAMKNAQIKGVLEGLSTIDEGANKILDINSMMSAMDDYIAKALEGNIGVPINYYLKNISKAELAEMWVAKYFPGKFLSLQADDKGSDAPKPT